MNSFFIFLYLIYFLHLDQSYFIPPSPNLSNHLLKLQLGSQCSRRCLSMEANDLAKLFKLEDDPNVARLMQNLQQERQDTFECLVNDLPETFLFKTQVKATYLVIKATPPTVTVISFFSPLYHLPLLYAAELSRLDTKFPRYTVRPQAKRSGYRH